MTKLNTVKILSILENTKAEDIVTINASKRLAIANQVIICTATSRRHAKALSQHLTKNLDFKYSVNVQGSVYSEWIIVDFMDIIIHIMLPNIRDFYQLEKIWQDPDQTTIK